MDNLIADRIAAEHQIYINESENWEGIVCSCDDKWRPSFSKHIAEVAAKVIREQSEILSACE